MKALAALALLVTPVSAGANSAPASWQLANSDVTTVVGEDGHPYRVLIAWPDGAPPPEGWPVLFVLDGEDNFAIATLTARRLARAGARSGVVPGVIVGVDSGSLARRVLDYTPAAPGYAIPAGAPAHGLRVGGGARFLTFLKDRLTPWIDRRWRTDPSRRTIAGHSFGGLLALHAMVTRHGAFTRFAAVSPSLWYGDGLIERAAQAEGPLTGARLFIASGERERDPVRTGGATAETLAKDLAGRGADVRFLSLSGQSHGTTMLSAMGDIVTLAFARAAT